MRTVHKKEDFDGVTRRIRYVSEVLLLPPFSSVYRCFPHVVNLACKAVLAAITDLDFARPNAGPFVPTATHRDAIAIVRTAIRAIRASSLRRAYFEEVIAALKQKNMQLLRDVETRWSSTLLMVERAILLRAAIDKIMRETPELNKYRLQPHEWLELEQLQKVPHAFQQILSGEKTPTLCNAIPSFERMARRWEQLKTELPGMSSVIDRGLDKLEEYRDKTDVVPAYVMAMCKVPFLRSNLHLTYLVVVHPNIKLKFFEEFDTDNLSYAKDLILKEVCCICYIMGTRALTSP
ncbi:uncharacterized protein SCHCODRAFT_01093448 [Schizophyllum commune H4-8]|uniref:uncharacterized protein n=1 Tax=Schizophyllum commune (strain H4-8 / FGSC 9210) TaxID=578458 RepID=UPI00215EE1E1|nr:uncharacterized protein SCHCODRAFT_01093448 [Schizophyllum commune H4-8]KAI5896313.1 hypothetical protein SCHCODRAFT_01093448 [Schizophyllum commune H4-8]